VKMLIRHRLPEWRRDEMPSNLKDLLPEAVERIPKTGYAAKAWRRKHDPTSLEALRARLAFLESRVNSHSDPAIQKLIADTRALLNKPKGQR
jgi:hypothetical protein